MARVRIALVAVMFACAPALADSVVTYTLQLGGDNHAADIKAGTRVPYTPGNPDDGQTFDAGVLDWAMVLQVTGNHSQPEHPSDGLLTQGVANFIFNLRLETDTGALVTDVDYYSTIHDGGTGLTCDTCYGGYTLPDAVPFCAGAAFAFSFDSVGWGPGRVFEAYYSGLYTGPFMEVAMLPTVDVGNTSGVGQLLGIGAGYGRWSRGGGNSTLTTKGVGQTVAEGGWGIVPVVEGQIDTSALAPGTYVLKLEPGTGTNVLRGDVDLVSPPGTGVLEVQAFAVPANQAIGDQVIFEITAPSAPPVLVSAESVKNHETVGDLGMDVPLSGNAVEPRAGSLTQLVASFDQDVFGVGGLSVDDVSLSAGVVEGVTINGSVVTVDVSGVPDGTVLTVGFPGIENGSGQPCADSLCVRTLLGDVNGDGQVSIFDLVIVRDNTNQPVTEANCKSDLNLDGAVSIFDLVIVRDQTGGTVGLCP